MNWEMSPPILGLTFLSVSPGLSGNPPGGMLGEQKDHRKAVGETLVLGAIAAHVTKSWWPLVGPIAFLVWDFMYYKQIDGVPATDVTYLEMVQ